MKKKIWYISKYCNIANKNSTGSRGWILMKKFALRDHETLIITSDNSEVIESYNFSKFANFIKKDNVKIIILKALKYSVSKSILRIISWLDFEVKVF